MRLPYDITHLEPRPGARPLGRLHHEVARAEGVGVARGGSGGLCFLVSEQGKGGAQLSFLSSLLPLLLLQTVSPL
jgi:hypothetical protein